MASVWYVGTASSYTITALQWAQAGAPGTDSVWNAANGWSLSQSGFSSAQVTLLSKNKAFTINQPNGPRPSTSGSGISGDVIPPSAPGPVTVSLNSNNQPVVSWTPASDNISVSYYLVRRDAAVVGTTTSLTYTDTTAVPGTFPIYSIIAVDNAGNAGLASIADAVAVPSVDNNGTVVPIYQWQAGQSILEGQVLLYNHAFYQALEAHIADITFDSSKFEMIAGGGTGTGTGTIPSASSNVLGGILLAGDLTGTANSPLVKNGAVTVAKIAAGGTTPDNTKYLRGDGTWQVPPVGTGGGTSYTDEQAQDAAAALFNHTRHTNATFAYDDVNNQVVASVPAYTDEQAQDAAAALFTAGTHSNISFAYNDAGNALNATVTLPASSTPDATTTAKGAVQLAGDLGGTAVAPTVMKLNGQPIATVATTGSWNDLLNKPSIGIDGSVALVATRKTSSESWKVGLSNAVVDFSAARLLGRPIDFRSPAAAAPAFGTAPEQQHYGDTWLELPAAAFDPNSIANLLYFWDPDTLTATDGSAVASLAASVGGSNAGLGQTTAARQPTVQTLSDGKRVIRFSPDGTSTNDDYLVATLPAAQATPFTAFVVHDVTGTAATQEIMQAGAEISITSAGSLQAYAGSTLNLTGQVPPLSLGVTVVVFNGTTSKIYRNGGTPASGTTGTTITSLSTAFRIGQHSTAGRPFAGNIGRLGIYSRALTLQEINDLGSGLAAQYTTSTAWTVATT